MRRLARGAIHHRAGTCEAPGASGKSRSQQTRKHQQNGRQASPSRRHLAGHRETPDTLCLPGVRGVYEAVIGKLLPVGAVVDALDAEM
jgi:hypothetical protein